MKSSRGLRRIAVLGLGITALALMAGACGGDDDDDDDTGGNTPAATQGSSNASPTGSSGGASPTAAGADEPEVTVADNVFAPDDLTVEAGTTVTWNWSGAVPHSVVGEFNGEEVKSETMTGSGSFEFTFEEPGTFEYQCGVHGASMAGKITVE